MFLLWCLPSLMCAGLKEWKLCVNLQNPSPVRLCILTCSEACPTLAVLQVCPVTVITSSGTAQPERGMCRAGPSYELS